MGRSAWSFAGMAVGAYFGGPVGAQVGGLIGGAIGGAVEGPTRIQGPSINETGVQTSQEGAPRAIVYGTASVTGNVIVAGALIPIWYDVESDSGKGDQGTVTSTQALLRSFAIRICEGPIAGVLRVWEDNRLVYDVRPGSAMLAQSAAWVGTSTVFYLGTEDQLPDAFMTLAINLDMPAYRGTAYMLRGLADLTARRGSIPQYRFEVAGTASTDQTLNPLIVHPWVAGLNPMNADNEHEFQYRGFAGQSGSPQQPGTTFGAMRDDIAGALIDMANGWNTDGGVFTPPAFPATPFLVAWEAGGGFFPLDGIDPVAGDFELIRLHYNEVSGPSYSAVSVSPGAMPEYAGGVWGGYDGVNPWVAYRAIVNGGVGSGQWYSPSRNYSSETYTFTDAGDGMVVYYTYDGMVNVKRIPVAPDGFTKVTGTAKQLGVVEYRDGVLYQNGVGPVLLPDDPDYDNATFWSDARDAAITEGTLESDVSSPVVVSEYATGYATLSGLPIPLAGIVADISARCKLPASKFDVSELDDNVSGLVLAGDYAGADGINALRTPYFFDKCEHDKKIYFPKRGGAVVTTITIDDLVEMPDESTRQQAAEYPKKVHLFYQHADSGYAAVKSTSTRSSPDARVVGEATISVPVVLNEDQAAQTAAKLHKVMWAEADGEIKISLPESFIWLTPSDNIGLDLRGRVIRCRIESMNYAAGVIELTLKHDRQSAYTSNLTGVPVAPPTLPPTTIVGDTTLAVLDISARTDSEDDLHYLVAGTGALPGWSGWQLQRSLDAGANYTTVANYTRAPVMGVLVDAFPAASEYFTDTTNTVRVQLYRDGQTIDSITDAQFLSEGGAFVLVSESGASEVLQYLDADDEGDGVFALTTLHRGQLNSGASAHTAGETFVMLRDAQHVDAQSAWIGQALTSRAVSLGASPETGTVETISYTGKSQREWPVASLTLTRTGDDVTASWAPRHRFGTDDAPVESINFRGFRVTITGTGTITFDTVAQTFTQDVSAIGGAVSVSVSALNRITGAGPATSDTI